MAKCYKTVLLSAHMGKFILNHEFWRNSASVMRFRQSTVRRRGMRSRT
jgi:hypothetical protein